MVNLALYASLKPTFALLCKQNIHLSSRREIGDPFPAYNMVGLCSSGLSKNCLVYGRMAKDFIMTKAAIIAKLDLPPALLILRLTRAINDVIAENLDVGSHWAKEMQK